MDGDVACWSCKTRVSRTVSRKLSQQRVQVKGEGGVMKPSPANTQRAASGERSGDVRGRKEDGESEWDVFSCGCKRAGRPTKAQPPATPATPATTATTAVCACVLTVVVVVVVEVVMVMVQQGKAVMRAGWVASGQLTRVVAAADEDDNDEDDCHAPRVVGCACSAASWLGRHGRQRRACCRGKRRQ